MSIARLPLQAKTWEAKPAVITWPTFLTQVKRGEFSPGLVLDVAEPLREALDWLAEEGPFKDQRPNLELVNKLLLDVRKSMWEPKSSERI